MQRSISCYPRVLPTPLKSLAAAGKPHTTFVSYLPLIETRLCRGVHISGRFEEVPHGYEVEDTEIRVVSGRYVLRLRHHHHETEACFQGIAFAFEANGSEGGADCEIRACR